MSTLQAVELGVLGPLQVRQHGAPVTIPGAKPRAVLTMLGLHYGSLVSADTLLELLWGDEPPRTAAKALPTHISALRRALGDGFVLTEGAGWTLTATDADTSRYKSAARQGRDAVAAGDTSQAVVHFDEAIALWRGIPELPDGRRGTSEKTRWIEGHAALVEDRAEALLAAGRSTDIIGELEAAVAEAPLRERRWGQLMLALYRAGRQGDALGAYRRARVQLAEELGVDPGSELRRLEGAIVAQDSSLDISVAHHLPSVMRAVTFLLTDIEGSTAAWEADAEAMALALARHDELVELVVTARGGRLIKTRGEGDATFSVFDRPSAAAAAAIELQHAIRDEPWVLAAPMRIRVALHTGEVELRGGDYFGRAVNRAARLRSLTGGGQILCSGATAELVIDSLPDDVVLTDLGMRHLKNLPRPEHVFQLGRDADPPIPPTDLTPAPMQRPDLPPALVGRGPFVGRNRELDDLGSTWQATLAGAVQAVLIAGEPGVGKTRLAGEWSRRAYEQGAIVLYGRCDEDLGAPYQPFAEALRVLVPCVGPDRLRELRGVEALLALVPGLTDVLPDVAAPASADPDTERYALFDAVVALLRTVSSTTPMVLILDDLHWAAKPTLLLLRHLLRFGEHARVHIIGTYRGTDLDRSHPLAARLADLHRDGTADRLQLNGLDETDVTAYVTEAGYDDPELARALASVTGGNPFFLIEALRHVDETGGRWNPNTLPQGVREAVSRRLSRLTVETNKALAAAAVVGSRFALELVEQVVEQDLVDAFDEACKAGILIEEAGGHYRFNHALVRQSLLAELPSVRRMRLHQRIATILETRPGADDELLAELAHHYFECAWAGNAAKAVEYCRRAADQAMARLGYEGAADLYDRALHALEEIDDELPDREDQTAALLIARCEALLAAGDVASAAGTVAQLQEVTADSARLSAWATCFDGQLSILMHPERLDEAEVAVGEAAGTLARIGDAAGEAKAHTVRAGCLARLGRIGDCEIALDDALTAARRADEQRRVNAVLANAPLAALWGPSPVPRAGGRCLDVVRLLRITTDSPAVEAASTRCQAVLEAFRGRAEAARRMIDSARRMVAELGLRHALLEVEQFAGIIELIVGDPTAAEPHLREAYNGFRRMGLDADSAETAALLGRACLALDRDAEADELCSQSERLAGHALKASISWRTLRALLLSRAGDHNRAAAAATDAVALAERTDILVDHGDACLALATVLNAAGDAAGARTAAQRATSLYEQKGAAALAERAGLVFGEPIPALAPTPPEAPAVELDTAAIRTGERVVAAIDRGAWDEFEHLFSPEGSLESRRKIVGFNPTDLPPDWIHQNRLNLEAGEVRLNYVVLAVRGERLALVRLTLGTAEMNPGAPQDEFLQVYGIDEEGRVTLQVWFDLDDMDAAIAELDVAHTRLGQHHQPVRTLENAASRLYERFKARFAARDWHAITDMLAENVSSEDFRRVVNNGLQQGKDAVMGEISSLTAVGLEILTEAVAIRGEHLVLSRTRVSGSGEDPTGFHSDGLDIVESDAYERVVAHIVFDRGEFEAAVAELEARYLSGEAASHAHTWSIIAQSYAAANNQQLRVADDSVSIDHRRARAFAPGELAEYMHATWIIAPNVTIYVETVHRLSTVGAVVTHVGRGSSQEGFNAEWREVALLTVGDDLINRTELFDETDLDAALTRFDELQPQPQRLENTASRLDLRFWTYFSDRDWDAMAAVLAEDFSLDDRRHVLNAGIRQGRYSEIENLKAIADLIEGVDMTPHTIATRGERLALRPIRFSGQADGREAFYNVMVGVVEINADNQLSSHVVFDVVDFDAAIAELDARYLAGEAAAYARTWSVIAEAHAGFNRHELPATTPDPVYVDHRPLGSMEDADLPTTLHSVWALASNLTVYIETVHRLSERGVVVTTMLKVTSHEGLDAELRMVQFVAVQDDLLSRIEVFDEADLDAAIARFEELRPQPTQLGNPASRVHDHFFACFRAAAWPAIAEILTADSFVDDRRRVTSSGLWSDRDDVIANLRALADAAPEPMGVIATRGEHLALTRVCSPNRNVQYGEFSSDMLILAEIGADERIVAQLVFDIDDIDSALAELDARYLIGEAAPNAHSWSVLTKVYAAANRQQLRLTPDCVNIDHRRLSTIVPGSLETYIRTAWDESQSFQVYIAEVHRLGPRGAVFTQAARGTSDQGFDADWREVIVATFDGDLINRCELFSETDLDAALERFEQLNRSRPALENAATRNCARVAAAFNRRDGEAIFALASRDGRYEDRRQGLRSVLVGPERRRVIDATVNTVPNAWRMEVEPIAIRGSRFSLTNDCYRDTADPDQPIVVEMLHLMEVDAAGRMQHTVTFDVADFDSAITELDARYLAGEGAGYAHTWSLITGAYAAFNRREILATTPDWVNIDHRRGAAVAPGDVIAYIQAVWDDSPDTRLYIAAVHRLSNIGAVVTHVMQGISQEGFETEWRDIHVLTFNNGLIDRSELFEGSDLDAALARFDELQSSEEPDAYP